MSSIGVTSVTCETKNEERCRVAPRPTWMEKVPPPRRRAVMTEGVIIITMGFIFLILNFQWLEHTVVYSIYSLPAPYSERST